jgi:hypothetical protein
MTDVLALTNGRIWTGEGFARSVVLRGGRVASVDADVPRDAEVIDLRGRLVVPGFVDNHLHFVMGSLQLARVQLRDARSREELARRVAERAREAGPGQWITGGGWDEQAWSPAIVPTRRELDGVTPDNPVFVTRLDLHMGWRTASRCGWPASRATRPIRAAARSDAMRTVSRTVSCAMRPCASCRP